MPLIMMTTTINMKASWMAMHTLIIWETGYMKTYPGSSMKKYPSSSMKKYPCNLRVKQLIPAGFPGDYLYTVWLGFCSVRGQAKLAEV